MPSSGHLRQGKSSRCNDSLHLSIFVRAHRHDAWRKVSIVCGFLSTSFDIYRSGEWHRLVITIFLWTVIDDSLY